jgi:hypothetical protein
MREVLQISTRKWPQRVRPGPTLTHKIEGGEIVDFTRLEALGAKDIVCKDCFGRLSRLFGNVWFAMGSGSRLPECEPGGAAESS